MEQALDRGTVLKSPNYEYKIDHKLGSGSFGITYLATALMEVNGPLGKVMAESKVCIKEFFMADMNTRKDGRSEVDKTGGSVVKNYMHKFRKEAENLSRLQHKHIVHVLEVFETNNTCYYSMEYIDGSTLDDYVLKKNGLDEAEAEKCIREIGDALDYMHSQRMLHLDLKPKNVMRRTNGDLVLIDFGLSKQYDAQGNPESTTNLGGGTPGYAPIEQCASQKGLSFPVSIDVYALAATYYKLLTGQTPPEADEVMNNSNVLMDSLCPFSDLVVRRICWGMAPLRVRRAKSVRSFLYDEPPTKSHKDAIDYEPDSDFTRMDTFSLTDWIARKKYLLITAVVACLLAVFLPRLWHAGAGASTADKQVSNQAVTIQVDGATVNYLYTGSVKNGLPQGGGKATLADGTVYEGNFKEGNRDASIAKQTLPNGDLYVGSFVQNHYDKGKYKVKEDGSYFDGLFRDDKPYDGTWFYKNGKVMYKVVKGQDNIGPAK